MERPVVDGVTVNVTVALYGRVGFHDCVEDVNFIGITASTPRQLNVFQVFGDYIKEIYRSQRSQSQGEIHESCMAVGMAWEKLEKKFQAKRTECIRAEQMILLRQRQNDLLRSIQFSFDGAQPPRQPSNPGTLWGPPNPPGYIPQDRSRGMWGLPPSRPPSSLWETLNPPRNPSQDRSRGTWGQIPSHPLINPTPPNNPTAGWGQPPPSSPFGRQNGSVRPGGFSHHSSPGNISTTFTPMYASSPPTTTTQSSSNSFFSSSNPTTSAATASGQRNTPSRNAFSRSEDTVEDAVTATANDVEHQRNLAIVRQRIWEHQRRAGR